MYLTTKPSIHWLITGWLAVALTLLDALQSLGCPLGNCRIVGGGRLTQVVSSAD